MALITLLTDSGISDHYIASIKAKILGVNPGLQIVDICHTIPPCDIAHGAYVLKTVFRDFPKGTVHLVGVHATGNRGDLPIALQLEDHFFIGIDNGLFGLISDRNHQYAVELLTPNGQRSTFPEKDIFAAVAARLASGVSITDLGKPLSSIKKMIDRQVKATKKLISGHVVHVDHFGNLITNIPLETFELLNTNKTFTIQLGGEKFRKLQTSYNQVEEGECFILFNQSGHLEIGIYKGNASELLGLGYDSTVTIVFGE